MKIRNILLTAMAVTGALSLGSCSKHDDAAARISYEVKAVNKLVLSQMTISKMASVSDIDFSKAKGLKQSAAAALDAVKIGDRKAAYSYDTYMRAYIDLSAAFPGKTVIVTDPTSEGTK